MNSERWTARRPGRLGRAVQSFRSTLVLVIMPVFCCVGYASTLPLPQQMANAAMKRWPDGHPTSNPAQWKWDSSLGTLLEGMTAVWQNTADPAYYHYIQRSVDGLIRPDGSIPTFDAKAHSLDEISMGRQLLLLYRVTQDPKYYKAAALLRRQLTTQPRNASGGFWQQGQSPDQMWLDGLYMAEPFYAEYAAVFHEPRDFAGITRQFSSIDAHARDPKTGLLYSGWDKSKKAGWANKTTAGAANFWGRGTGWYMMALVDALPYYRADDPGRAKLIAILNRTAAAVAKVQDPGTGLWYRAPEKRGGKGNQLESSAAGMFVYAFAKGVRLGYLPPKYAETAARGYRGMLQRLVQNEKDGRLTIGNTAHEVGVFLLAGSEMEMAPHVELGRGDTVLMDGWFNSAQRTNAAGQKEPFHYKWDDKSNSGFSLLGHIFRSYGVSTATLYQAPTLRNLKDAQIYMIVSPDIPVKNPHPHYVQPKDAAQVAEWVKRGGVLVLMENDPANADIEHLDRLADRFGIHFNAVLANHVVGDNIDAGRVAVSGNLPIFPGSRIFYMKDTCTISVHGAAAALVKKEGNVLMATARYGRGTMFAVVDPWVYNEYTDGHNLNLPAEYDNFSGAKDMARWLIQQVPGHSAEHAR